jgi:hypothetical protein
LRSAQKYEAAQAFFDVSNRNDRYGLNSPSLQFPLSTVVSESIRNHSQGRPLMSAAEPINYKALVPEFGIYSPYSPLVVAVEYLHGSSTPESAAFFREQLLLNGHTPPHAPYLLMPSDEHVYMWKRV